MEHIQSALGEIQKINDFYQLPADSVLDVLQEMATSQVSTPVIGKFSAGKSALINTLLGYSRPLLREAITPETAVPTEISYALEDSVELVYIDQQIEQTDIKNFRSSEYDAERIECIRIKLRNGNLLADIPDVRLVDMPGFESGYDVHNRSIDRYLPQSLAYIIAFSADDMTLKASMRGTLNELNLHQMPICIAITKRDKVSDDILQANLAKLKVDMGQLLGRGDLTYCITSSQEDDANELRQFLLELQEQSRQLLGGKYRSSLIREADKTAAYLTALLNNNHLSMSELEEQEEKLNTEMNELNRNVDDEMQRFASGIPAIIRDIQGDVRNSLQEAEGTFVAMILNNQEIPEKVNLIVRETLTRSMQQRFLPKVKRYIQTISDNVKVEVFADAKFMTGRFNLDTDGIGKKITNGVVAGISVLILGPLLTIIGAIANYFISKRIQEKKREEAKAQIQQKLLTEVFPNIVSQVGANLEIELKKHIEELNRGIAEEIANQRKLLTKALAELKSEHTREQLTKQQLREQAESHLQRIEELKHGL